MAHYVLNNQAVEHARGLIAARQYVLDGDWHRCGPGTFLSVPPNIEHGFRPCGGPFRMLNIHAPNVGFVDGLRS